MSEELKTKTHLMNVEIDPDTIERDDAIIGVALRWSLGVFAGLAAIIGVALYFLWPEPPKSVAKRTELAPVKVRDGGTVEIPKVHFTDITRQAGITFKHENGAAGRKLLPETMGGGCAFFDFDNDGDQDLLLVNSTRWPWDRKPTDLPEKSLALYRNDGKGNFTDGTKGSGLEISCFGMGVAVGDYDGDGNVDVFLATLGANVLFRNQGGGKFQNVTSVAGVAGDDKEWSTSSGFFDYDNDGDLDLFVCNYVKWSREFDEAQNFQLVGGGRAYGRPQNFEGTFPYLYRNEGNGRFTDVTAAAGLAVRNVATGVPLAKSLGVVFSDLDSDGWIDIVVANDTVQNFLFHNQKNGTFREVGAEAGVAFDMNGAARGAMGIDVARFRETNAVGLTIGNFANEMTALYVSYGNEMQFMDEAISSGLGPNTRLELTFGVFYADYDLDGRLDIFAANGHLEEDINRVQPSQHYEQSPQLFWNCGPAGSTEFLPVNAAQCGSDFVKPMVGRGATYADIDNDGDLDILLTGIGQPPRLLRNDQAQGHHWLRLKLIGTKANRDAIGACAEVQLADGRTLHRQVLPTRSYLSQVELPVTFGLGSTDNVAKVVVRWPDGSTQDVPVGEVDRTYEVRQDNTARTTVEVQDDSRPTPAAPELDSRTSSDAQFRISDFGFRMGAPNPQSAIRNRQAVREHSSCGNYLTLADEANSDSQRMPNKHPKAPCDGPSCSGGPPPATGMTPSPVRLTDLGQGVVQAVAAVPYAPPESDSVPSDSPLFADLDEVGGIFRPPQWV